MERLGAGIGWRPEIAEAVERMAGAEGPGTAPGVDWVEAVAENLCPGHLPESLLRLRARGVTVVPHGVGLGLGGAPRPDPQRLAALAERAVALESPLVTEHIAFVRAGGERTGTPAFEAGHLLPVPRTKDALDVLCENIRIAQDSLPVPLAVENIAALLAWPGEEMTEGQFLHDLVERTGVRLLIDVANLYTNQVNRGEDAALALAELPVEAIAYVHVAGGVLREGVWHDTHAHPVPPQVLDILARLRGRAEPAGVLLERDDNFPAREELEGELRAIRETVGWRSGQAAGARGRVPHAAPATHGPSGGRAATPDAGVTAVRPDDAARTRLDSAQAGLLCALVAGGPVPPGFDARRVGVQSRALAAKRAEVVAKVAPELPKILGDTYRPAFLAYAATRPLTGGYRRDALDFAAHLLRTAPPEGRAARRGLTAWWRERSGPTPPKSPARRTVQLTHGLRERFTRSAGAAPRVTT